MTLSTFLTFLGIGTPVATAVGGYAVKRSRETSSKLAEHEGRLDSHDLLFTEREKRADERHRYVTERFDYLDEKMDTLIKLRRQ